MVENLAKKNLMTPLGPKIPQGCSEEWKFEAEAPEGIEEERSSVLMEKRTAVVRCFFAVKKYTHRKNQKGFFYVWGLM